MTTDFIPLAFEETLVRAARRDGEPWFIGKDVCTALEIKNHNDALGRLDDDERSEVVIADPSGSKKAIAISQPGVFRLIFISRKPAAERFKRWLAHDVLPQLRQTGRYAPGPAEHAENARDYAAEAMLHRLHVVREARILFGADRARSLWRHLGLPAVPPPPAGPRDEAQACLRHLLDSPAYADGPRVRDLLALALDGEEEERVTLLGCGIRVMPELDAFVVANRHPRLDAIFKPTAWCGPLVAMRVLRRIPGAEAGSPMRWPGPLTPGNPVVRGTVLKGEMLDEAA